MRKAPGSGITHFYHGVACAMLNRPEETLSHLKTAERLSPGWHLMWAVKEWQSHAHRAMGRWAEADAATDETINHYPSLGFHRVMKAHCCVQLGQETAGRQHIETARRLGWDPPLAELHWRRMFPNSPRLEADIATIRALYAATEPGA